MTSEANWSVFPWKATNFGGDPSMTLTSDDLERSKMLFFSIISQTIIDRDSICIMDIYELIYGLSFGTLTLDLEPRSKVMVPNDSP